MRQQAEQRQPARGPGQRRADARAQADARARARTDGRAVRRGGHPGALARRAGSLLPDARRGLRVRFFPSFVAPRRGAPRYYEDECDEDAFFIEANFLYGGCCLCGHLCDHSQEDPDKNCGPVYRDECPEYDQNTCTQSDHNGRTWCVWEGGACANKPTNDNIYHP